MMENLFDLKRNWYLIVTKVAIIVVFLAGLYSAASFLESTESAVDTSFSSTADQNLYSLTDTLTDGDEFGRFREDAEALGRLGVFYNTLNSSDQVSLVSAFAQPIVIADFRGGDNFDARAASDFGSSGEYTDPVSGRTVRDVLSMQMNKHTFDFAGLQISGGTPPDWGSIDYSTGVIPVVLGANYAGVYRLGDKLDAQLYSDNFTFEVTGFLAPDSSMFYKGDINFFLDDYLLVPYPPALTTPTEEDLFFSGILSFAMVNSAIAAPKSLSSDEVITYLDTVTRQSGFEEYALINVPQYLTQFSLTRSLLVGNAQLVGVLESVLGLVVLFVLASIGIFTYRRRLIALDIRWKLGTPSGAIQWSLASMLFVEWVVITMVFWSVYSTLPTADSEVSGTASILVLTVATIDIGIALTMLRQRISGKRES